MDNKCCGCGSSYERPIGSKHMIPLPLCWICDTCITLATGKLAQFIREDFDRRFKSYNGGDVA